MLTARPSDMSNYFTNIFTLLRGFHNDELGPNDVLRFNAIIVRHVCPKVASRILKFNKLWTPEAHPVSILEQFEPSSLDSADPLHIKTNPFVAGVLRNKCLSCISFRHKPRYIYGHSHPTIVLRTNQTTGSTVPPLFNLQSTSKRTNITRLHTGHP